MNSKQRRRGVFGAAALGWSLGVLGWAAMAGGAGQASGQSAGGPDGAKDGAAAPAAGAADQAAPWKDAGWPRQFETGTHVVRVHQPQLEEWPKFDRIKFRAAVCVERKGEDAPTYGTLVMSAATRVAFEERLVALSDRRIESLEFPGVDADEAVALRKVVVDASPPERTMTVSLDRIIAALDMDPVKMGSPAVNLMPPKIYASESPAVLVMFLGKPRFKLVGETGLMAAVNTNWDVFKDNAGGAYYLLVEDGWLTAAKLESGEWKPAGTLPEAFSKLPADENWADVRAAVPGKPVARAPKVIVSNEPAELIVTEGPPEMEAISDTALMLVANTESDLFYSVDEKRYYLLASGRWFAAGALSGPWSAASASLPEDFRKIPEDSDAGAVLASVPGTAAAKEAVVLASIPNKAVVEKSAVNLQVEYAGTPDFRPIEGTVVRYAHNSPYSVFLVNARYYCCHNAVWFEAGTPTGAWVVCTAVPKEIYTIPPSSPMHNVTYVTVYESTPTTVTTGYTGGYTGAQVATTGAVMFGLGVLLGAALDDDDEYWAYHYHSGFYSYGCGVSHYAVHGGWVSTGVRYGPYGGAGGFAAYNPATGAWARGAYAYGPRGAAGVRTGYNPSTGWGGYRAGAVTPYGAWSRGAVTNGDDWVRGGRATTSRGTVGGVQGSGGAGAVHAEGRYGNGVTVAQTRDGDVYAGKDGNVYKRTDSGWEQQSRPTPRQATPTTAPAGQRPTTTPAGQRPQPTATPSTRQAPSAEQSAYLQRESAARARGNQNVQRSTTQRSAPSGGSRGGGRRR